MKKLFIVPYSDSLGAFWILEEIEGQLRAKIVK